MAVQVAQDPLGFGRLAEMQMRIKEFDQQQEMNKLNTDIARQNLMQLQADQNFKTELQSYMQNRPEGVNPYVYQREFALSRGRTDYLDKLDNMQLNKIASIAQFDPEAAVNVANETVGQAYGTQFRAPEGKMGKVIEAVDSKTGESVFVTAQNGQLVPLQGYQPPSKQPLVQNIVGGQEQTKGRTKTDEAYAKEYVDYKAAGGAADQLKQLNQLQEALTALESGKELTGPITGSMPDFILKFANPEALKTRQDVEEVVQRNLRQILGAQFTEKEGERLISRAYDPNLSEQENARRVRRLLKQMEVAALVKEDAARYWEQNGTLTGWQGKMPTISDFMAIDFGGEDSKQTSDLSKFWK